MDEHMPIDENLPINVDDQEDHGTITYATDVISTIVGVATAEVEGIASMAGASSISDILGRSKNVSRGVKVEVGAEEVSVEVSVIVDYGMPIQKVCQNVQDNVLKSIETMTGLHVIKVDVHVQGVSFEKENLELKQGQEVARLTTERGTENAQAEADEFDLDSVMPAEEPEAEEVPTQDVRPDIDAEETADAQEDVVGDIPEAAEDTPQEENAEQPEEESAKGKKASKDKNAEEA